MQNRFLVAMLIATACVTNATSASADVVISGGPTSNMSCSGGVCMPTGVNAVLNVTDLENLLGSGNVSVVTTNGSVQANNIDITAAFSWSVANSLTLDAYQSITVSAVVQNLSTGNVSLVTNDGSTGGALTFAIGSGRLDTNSVSINGATYAMETSVRELAADVVAQPHGNFALSKTVNAKREGLFYTSPIPIAFGGRFNGLGHEIDRLEIADVSGDIVGLFGTIGKGGSIASVTLSNVIVDANGSAGGLVGVNKGSISNCSSSGKISAFGSGGLVSNNFGSISASASNASVSGKQLAGGLAAANSGTIVLSLAIGATTGGYAHSGGRVGGLVGLNGGGGTIQNSYALGNTLGNLRSASVGGFAGFNIGSIATGYSIGSVSGKGRKDTVGGFDGYDQGTISNSYWDTDTSGQIQGSGDGNETGLTGLTTAQFQSGLPAGFDPAIWAEDANINNGFPYLIANPPTK